MDLVCGEGGFCSCDGWRFILFAVIFGCDKVQFKVCPSFISYFFLAPFFTSTIEEARGTDVLITPADELGVINDFVAAGGKGLSSF